MTPKKFLMTALVTLAVMAIVARVPAIRNVVNGTPTLG